jgi:hypothetical protein
MEFNTFLVLFMAFPFMLIALVVMQTALNLSGDGSEFGSRRIVAVDEIHDNGTILVRDGLAFSGGVFVSHPNTGNLSIGQDVLIEKKNGCWQMAD